MRQILFTLFIIVFTAINALGGVKFKMESYELGETEKNTTTSIFTEDMLKFQTYDEGKSTSIIFNAKKDKMFIINHESKSYMVMDKEKMKNLKRQFDNLKAKFENMPESTRKMMENMMSEQLEILNSVEYTVEETGKSQNINGWSTNQYLLKADGEVENEIWATSLSEIGVSEADMGVMKKYTEFAGELLDSFGGFGKDYFSAMWEKMKGFPVKTIHKSSGMVSETKSVEQYNANENDFLIPKGYSEQSMDIGN